jgi:putative hydrolase of the HAD superfamily
VAGAGGRIEAVTLDAAGTLFTVVEPVGTTYARIAARHSIKRAAPALEATFRAAFRAAPPLACTTEDPAALEAYGRAWWRRVVSETLDAGDAPGFDACFDELFAHFAEPRAWRVYPDVPPPLTTIRAAGIRTAVVSNFDRRLAAIVEGLGLAGLFDLIVPSSVAGAAKPAPAIFRHALCGLGVPAARALHAGDRLTEDVEGARAAGLRAVLVDRTTERHPPDVIVVGSLHELSSIVDASSN